MEGCKISVIGLRATSGHVIVFCSRIFVSFHASLCSVVQTAAYRRILIVLSVFVARQISMQGDETFMLFFIFSYFRIQYKKSHRQRNKHDDVEWEKKKTKRKSVESLFCIIHSPTVLDQGNFTSLDDGKDTPQKKLESLLKIRDSGFLKCRVYKTNARCVRI